MATIYIADADQSSALPMQAMLEGDGHTVIAFVEGHDLLEACAQAPPDAVFASVNLPVFSGFEVAAQLRADPDMPRDLPIVLLHSEPLDVRACERCGASATLERGADGHALRELSVALLGNRAGQAQGAD